MTTVSHATLTGSNLHEPKGASTALINTVYVSDGAGSGTWQTIGNSQTDGMIGNMALIKSVAASSSSTIDFVHGVSGVILDSTYDNYEIFITGVQFSSASNGLSMIIGTGVGPTWQHSGYNGGQFSIGQGTSFATYGMTSAINLTNNSSVNTETYSVSNYQARVKFANPASGSFFNISADGTYVDNALYSERFNATGMYTTAIAVTGIRFLPYSGTITSGRFSLYGYRTS